MKKNVWTKKIYIFSCVDLYPFSFPSWIQRCYIRAMLNQWLLFEDSSMCNGCGTRLHHPTNDRVPYNQPTDPDSPITSFCLMKEAFLCGLSPAADYWNQVWEVWCGKRQLLPLWPRLHFQWGGNQRRQEDRQILRRQPPRVGDSGFIFTDTSVLWIPFSLHSVCVSLQSCVLRWEPAPHPVPVRSQSNRRRLHWTLQVQTKEVPPHHDATHHYHTAGHHQAHT